MEVPDRGPLLLMLLLLACSRDMMAVPMHFGLIARESGF